MSKVKIATLRPDSVFDRTKPPKSGKPKDVNFPDFFETVTDNGINVVVIEDRKFPLVSSRFIFKSGSYSDHLWGKKYEGLSSVTSELLEKGTAQRTATDIADEIDFLGATLSTGCDYDATYISTYSLRKHFDSVFEIAADVILNPAFMETELKRVKEQRLNSLLSMSDDGDYLSEKIFRAEVYKNSPYALQSEGTEESISNINSKLPAEFFSKFFRPDNLIIAMVGDISPEEALQKINSSLIFPVREKTVPAEIILPEKKTGCRVFLHNKKGAVQSSLKVGHIGIKRNNPDFVILNVLNTLLGGYFTSRINKNLREEKGYTYGSRSSFNCQRFSGDFSVSTEVKNEVTADTISEILKEIKMLRNKEVGKTELKNVKNYITGIFPLQLETPNAIAQKVLNLKLNNLPSDYYNKFINEINSVTPVQIIEAANKYLHPDDMIISVAGNVSEIKDSLKQFGETVVVNE
ncbi:MAG: insulinase family protein [Bacteroidetes bacterium]|nr:insulinase family protein [Bacteroidota bacterium]